jgi:hypothetical protein
VSTGFPVLVRIPDIIRRDRNGRLTIAKRVSLTVPGPILKHGLAAHVVPIGKDDLQLSRRFCPHRFRPSKMQSRVKPLRPLTQNEYRLDFAGKLVDRWRRVLLSHCYSETGFPGRPFCPPRTTISHSDASQWSRSKQATLARASGRSFNKVRGDLARPAAPEISDSIDNPGYGFVGPYSGVSFALMGVYYNGADVFNPFVIGSSATVDVPNGASTSAQ